MQRLRDAIDRLGGLAKAAQLLDLGFTYRQLSVAARQGDVVRIRQGWYALDDDRPWVLAVRVGGRLACISAAVQHGLWALEARRPHVQVPPDARDLRSASDRRRRQRDERDAVVHWIPDACAHPPVGNAPRANPANPAKPSNPADDPRRVAPLLECLVQVARCRPWDEAVAVWDSALHLRRLTAAELDLALEALGGHLGARMRASLDRDAESGIESLVREPLRRAGFDVRTQVRRGGYRNDIELHLPTGAWLDIECDGHAAHAGVRTQHDDRRRDAAMTLAGAWVQRFSGAQIVARRAEVLHSIAAAVERLCPGMTATRRLRRAVTAAARRRPPDALLLGSLRRGRIAPTPRGRPRRLTGVPTRPRLTPWACVARPRGAGPPPSAAHGVGAGVGVGSGDGVGSLPHRASDAGAP